jgi:hypothetical protein
VPAALRRWNNRPAPADREQNVIPADSQEYGRIDTECAQLHRQPHGKSSEFADFLKAKTLHPLMLRTRCGGGVVDHSHRAITVIGSRLGCIVAVILGHTVFPGTGAGRHRAPSVAAAMVISIGANT